MNREDIIRMAREAGFAEGVAEIVGLAGFERLVELARFERLVELARADEREACAKVCEEQLQGKLEWKEGAIACAAAIRARGQG